MKLEFKPSDLKKPTVIILFLANLMPIYGVIFLGWEVFPILVLFWLENVIIGVFNILKMALCSPASPLMWVAKLFEVPFFFFLYFIFTLVHGQLIYTLFGTLVVPETEIPDLDDKVIGQIIEQIIGNNDFIWGLLALFLSHGISFVLNYVRNGEYKQASLHNLMWQPFKRVAILHVTVIIGAIILFTVGSPIGGLILLIVLKIVIDAWAHLKLHRGKGLRNSERKQGIV